MYEESHSRFLQTPPSSVGLFTKGVNSPLHEPRSSPFRAKSMFLDLTTASNLELEQVALATVVVVVRGARMLSSMQPRCPPDYFPRGRRIGFCEFPSSSIQQKRRRWTIRCPAYLTPLSHSHAVLLSTGMPILWIWGRVSSSPVVNSREVRRARTCRA